MANDTPVASWSDFSSRMQSPGQIKKRYCRTDDPEPNMSYIEIENTLTNGYNIPKSPSLPPSLPPSLSPEPQGILDTSFGTNGYNLTTPGTSDTIYAIALQPDGKIVAGGYATIGGTVVFALARYNSDGSLDTSFATNGYNLTTPASSDAINSVVLLPNGKILVGGYATVSGNNRFALARYNSNGALDTSFATNGFNITTPGTSDSIDDIILLPNGKIVAGGYATISGNAVFTVARYNADGSLDTSFATNGFNTVTPGTYDGIGPIAIQSDGKILAGGYAQLGAIYAFALARYNSNGSLDTSFATNGFNTTTPGTSDSIDSIVLQPDGKIVAGCIATISGKAVFLLTRYNSNGSLDTFFATNGYNTTTPGTTADSLNSIVTQLDGKFVGGGYTQVGGNNRFALTRYNQDGSLDTSFATNGFNTTTPGTSDSIASVILQPDGKIIACGHATISGNSTFAIARYK